MSVLERSDRMLSEMKEEFNNIVSRKTYLLILISYVIGSVIGYFINTFLVAPVGLFVIAIAWLLYANVLEEKEGSLRNLWARVARARAAEVKVFREPERQEEIEEELDYIYEDFKRELENAKKSIVVWSKKVQRALTLYAFGVGVTSISLTSSCTGVCKLATFILFSAILSLPLPTLISHLRSIKMRR